MSDAPRPVVFDCNVILQIVLGPRGAARACWQRVLDGQAQLYISPFILGEVRRLPYHLRILRRYPHITPERIERFVRDLVRNATVVNDPAETFRYERDPMDAHYVNLAIATGSLLVVSNDKDLLDLMEETNPDGVSLRRDYPTFRAVTPPQFLAMG